MADVPHQGPNLSRMPLEGLGGLIIASLPALSLLLVSPLYFGLWVAAGALLAPVIYWGNHRPQSRENLGGGIVALSFALLFATLIVAVPSVRGALLPWLMTSLSAATLIHWRAQERRPSIRVHA